MIHGQTLQPPALLTLTRVIHYEQHTLVQTNNYEYDDVLVLEQVEREGRTLKYQQRPTSSENEHQLTSNDNEHDQRLSMGGKRQLGQQEK